MRRHLVIGWLSALVLAATVTPAAIGGPLDAVTDRGQQRAAATTIYPGARTTSPAGQCTANFVFTAGGEVFIGSAAHCFSLGTNTDTDGCRTRSHPLGTPVTIQGASRPGVLHYSSWLTMQHRRERDRSACSYNDFALIRLDPADHRRVSPSIPYWGGPTGLGSASGYGDVVYANGNSGLRAGLAPQKVGTALGMVGAGWAHRVLLATPGIPGDSGGSILDERGRAVGVFSTLVVAPIAGSNHATDLRQALGYMEGTTGLRVRLLTGTTPFSGV